MDDKKLHAFLTVVQTGSLNKAAEQIGYTQPGLTQMMNSMEKEFGCKLLQRNNKGIDLTEEGMNLLPHMQKAYEAMSHLQQEIRHIVQGKQTPLRIGVYASISRTWLPKLVQSFHAMHPETPLEITVGGQGLTQMLQNDSIDLAFVDQQQAKGFTWVPIQNAPLAAVVPLNYPHTDSIALETLLKDTFITSPEQYVQSLLPPDTATNRFKIDAADDASIISMVETGMGVSVLCTLSLQGYAHRVRSIPLSPPIHCTLGLVHKPNPTDGTLIRDLVQCARLVLSPAHV